MTSNKYRLQKIKIYPAAADQAGLIKRPWTLLFQLPPDFNSPYYFGSYSRDTRRQSQKSTMELIHYTSITSHIKWSGTKRNPKNKRDSIIPIVVFSPYHIKEMIKFWSVHVRVQPQKRHNLKEQKTPNNQRPRILGIPNCPTTTIGDTTAAPDCRIKIDTHIGPIRGFTTVQQKRISQIRENGYAHYMERAPQMKSKPIYRSRPHRIES